MTYSIGTKGYVVGGNNLGPNSYTIPDTSADGDVATGAGGLLQVTQDADLMLVKGPDGGLHWYRYDAERSTVANPILVYVGP